MRRVVRTPIALPLFALAGLTAVGQEKFDRVAVYVTGLGSAAPVTQSLIKQMNASKPFQAVGQKDPSRVVVLVFCQQRNEGDLFACLYVAQHNGATFKTFLGAGLHIGRTAEEVGTDFFVSIASDIAERYNDTEMGSLRQALETCLLFTDTKCNVPDPLQKEFGAKQLTLGQYIMQKHE